MARTVAPPQYTQLFLKDSIILPTIVRLVKCSGCDLRVTGTNWANRRSIQFTVVGCPQGVDAALIFVYAYK